MTKDSASYRGAGGVNRWNKGDGVRAYIAESDTRIATRS